MFIFKIFFIISFFFSLNVFSQCLETSQKKETPSYLSQAQLSVNAHALITVSKMSCSVCASKIKSKVKEHKSVEKVQINLKASKKSVYVTLKSFENMKGLEISKVFGDLKNLVLASGYKVESIQLLPIQ